MAQAFNPFTLDGKTILVTGRGIAVTCSKMGAAVIISGRNETRLNETLAEMEGNGHSIVVGDLSDFSGLSALVGQLPKLDGIVHCAGIGDRTLCKMMTADDFDRMIGINLKAPSSYRQKFYGRRKSTREGV